MSGQYWVGDFFVDLTRNQITQKTQSQKIPPKALAVLTCLAKNANKVVSHDELLSEVWPDTVVTPNTLQRSIAQLRQALGENNHSYIKTHAKQGYSLEVEVRWQGESNQTLTDELTTQAPKKAPRRQLAMTIALAAIVILAFIGYAILIPTHSLKLDIAELKLLTATDNKEYGGIYSPDGEYVVFQRYSESICRNNNIWAKNTATQEEVQLTKNMGSYGSHSFSKDGASLVFIESNDCDQPITQKLCYELASIDFQKALKEPQTPNVLVECKNSKIVSPRWLNNNDIAFLQESSNRWKLTSYSIADNSSTVLYELDEGNILYFDYSARDDLIALNKIDSDGQQYIEILKPNGQVLSSHKIELPDEIPGYKYITPNFSPYSDQLIFSTGKQLFTLSYEGKVTNISLPLDEAISSPIFHPNEKQMLVIKGHYDSDIASMPLAQITLVNTAQNHSELSNNYTTIERSIKGEDYAQFQPQGELIAYSSARSGKNQLWVTDGENSQQISDFPIDSYIYDMDWAADGESILINADKELTQVFLDPRPNRVPLNFPVEKLFHWNSESNTALVTVRVNGELKFAEVDLTKAEFRVINDKKVTWALRSEDGRLIYTDQLEQFWQSGPVEDQRIEPLLNQGSNKNFITANNVIYGINDNFELWSYALDNNTFKIIGNVPETIDYITDINQTDILMTLRIAAKKEVAEIVLSD